MLLIEAGLITYQNKSLTLKFYSQSQAGHEL
jgi:hypothetical protein